MANLVSPLEEKFIECIVEKNMGPIAAAREAFGWKCEVGTREYMRAKALYRSQRVQKRILDLQKNLVKRESARQTVLTTNVLDVDNLRKMAMGELEKIRDDPFKRASMRLKAIKALEKLIDPATDSNLIMKWVDLVWIFAKAHCPACHADFPLWKVRNEKLDVWRKETSLPTRETPETDLDRRLVALSYADKRKKPHPGQVRCLEAKERHIVGLGAARAGKSWALASMIYLSLLIPGIEIWLLARVYEDARSEHDYLKAFLRSAFFPYEDKLVRIYENKQSGEMILLTKWGSELRIRSSKSKGSISGRELELCAIAEPGWVPGELYEEVRARMSSRLGRIIALGTPKGTAGFIGRMTKMTGRDELGRMVRRTAEDRLIANGCAWDISMLVTNIIPEENPEYVKSELVAARQELTDVEYASEFRGEMTVLENAKFPMITPKHLVPLAPILYSDAVFVLGIDQGPTNFGACLAAYDGNRIITCAEYFDSSINTMKKNLIILLKEVPRWIVKLGGDRESWIYTITDRHPQIDGIIEELKEEGYTWPTDVGTVPYNQRKLNENWRRETTEYVNNMAAQRRVIFDASHCEDIHEQVINVENKPLPQSDSFSESDKGWIVNDAWREDHVVDAWLFTMQAIMNERVQPKPTHKKKGHNVWEDYLDAFQANWAAHEKSELTGLPIQKAGTIKSQPNVMYRNLLADTASGYTDY